MNKRYYSVHEANTMLPQIKATVEALKQAREDIAVRRLLIERKKREMPSEDPDRFFAEEAVIEFAVMSAKQQIDHLLKQSIEVKDIDIGIVDFLTKVNGEEAYLCWRAGEAEIKYWHKLDGGYKGRIPLDEDYPRE